MLVSLKHHILHSRKPFSQTTSPRLSKHKRKNHVSHASPLKKKPSLFDLVASMAAPPPPPFDLLALPEHPLREPLPPLHSTCLATTRELACIISQEIEAPGVSTTIVTVSTQDTFSPLNGVEVAIKHYDTHPCSFLVELKSAPEATDLLTASMPALQLSLHDALPHFQIHVIPPSLLIVKQKSPATQPRKKHRKDKLPPTSPSNRSPYL